MWIEKLGGGSGDEAKPVHVTSLAYDNNILIIYHAIKYFNGEGMHSRVHID